MVTKREKELKERITRCMASMVLSDNVYANLQTQKIINEASKGLHAMKQESARTSGEHANE